MLIDDVAVLLGQQMNRVATIRGQLGQARDAIRAAIACYGTAEGRRILERVLEVRES